MDNSSSSLTLTQLAILGLCDTHEKVIRSLMALVQELPTDCLRVACLDRRPQWYEIDISPSNPSAARMMIYLCLHDPTCGEAASVVVNAGRDIAIDIVDIQYDDSKPDIVGLFENVVRAILGGHVRETLFYGGDVLYKSLCWVGTSGKPIEFDRTNVPKWLSALGKPRSRKTIVYEPYHQAEAR